MRVAKGSHRLLASFQVMLFPADRNADVTLLKDAGSCHISEGATPLKLSHL